MAVLSRLSRVNGIGLPYFKKHLKEYHVKDKVILCLPLCDGVHFQDYVVNTKERKTIHVDSLRWSTPNNPKSKCIAQIFFPNECKITFESLFVERKQLDANSWSVWLVVGICSHVLNLPELTGREHAFDICYILLEHKSKSNQSFVNMASSDFYCEEQLKKFSNAEFLTDILTNTPEKSEYYQELPPKGIRTNFFYITDLTKLHSLI